MTVSIAAIPETVRDEVETRLRKIEEREDVRFLLAVESGSRAWGFPSPDSDFDVRFIYVRKRDWYLSISPGRDVIETPLNDLIDLNGWDIRKALGLMLRSNVIVSEWIESPIRYRTDHPQVGILRELADQLFDPVGAMQHYAALGLGQADRWLSGEDAVPVKKYFYALRPALALRAIRLSDADRPPMNLQQLISVCDLPTDLTEAISELVALKALTNEKSNGRRFPLLDEFIAAELTRDSPKRKAAQNDEQVALANSFFRQLFAG